MAFTARDHMRGEAGQSPFGGYRKVFGLYGLRAALAGASLVALTSCSATSDPILQLGIAPEQLAQAEEAGSATAIEDAPEIAVSQDDDASDSKAPAGDEAGPAVAEAQATPSDASTKTAGTQQAAADAAKIEDTDAVADGAVAEGDDQTADASDSTDMDNDAKAEKRRSFLSAFFSPSPTRANAATQAIDETTAQQRPETIEKDAAAAKAPEKAAETVEAEEQSEPIVQTASTEAPSDETPHASLFGADALPGVRGGDSLFEISHKSGIDDDSTIDVYEDVGSYQVASAGGMARLAPNGLIVQREGVNVGCFKPELVRALKTIERHYGKRLVVTSGYRSPSHNRRVNGARHSLHMSCSAADIQMTGVSKWELAKFARSMPGRGGVGTYCHTNSIHVDTGPQRDWNWRCRRR